MRKRWIPVLMLVSLTALTAVSRADNAVEVYRALGIKPGDVIAGTVLVAPVAGPGEKQVISVTTYFTGSREHVDAVNVRLDVFQRRDESLSSIYTRSFGAENGGNVGHGNLQVLDLDMDGVNEIIVSFESYSDPLIDQCLGEVVVHDEDGFKTAWSGEMKYDATRAARGVPVERRDRFEREIDLENTMRTRGITLFFEKKVISVAGERLAQPKLVQETFPLRPSR